MIRDIFDFFEDENTDMADEIMAFLMFEEIMEDEEKSEQKEGRDAP